jgi:hypothetical protein
MPMKNKKASPGPATNISRREFARRAALAAAGAAIMPGSLAPAPLTPQGTAEGNKLSPAAQAEVELKIQAIFRKYGERLNDAQKTDIRRLVTEGQKPLQALRAYHTENWDQPATVLRIFPEASVETRRRPAASAAARKEN